FMAMQPMLGHLDYLLYVVVKSNAEYGAQKAAPDGMLTASVRSAVVDNLVAVGFTEDEIQIRSNTTAPLHRGEELIVEIEVPRMPMVEYNFSSEDLPRRYFGKAHTTSEYIP